MKIKKDKSLILNEIKLHYGFKNDYQFAEFLDISPSTLANWHSRDTFDVERIFSKCKDIDANWLLSGKGNMLLPKKKITEEYYEDHYPYAKVTIEEGDDKDEVDYKEKYIELLERYNAVLEHKLEKYLPPNT